MTRGFFSRQQDRDDKQGRLQIAGKMAAMVIPTGFEPVAYSLGNCRSILLSYGTIRCMIGKPKAAPG
jgi:hypothetical protein